MEQAFTGSAGVESAQDNPPDLAVVDLHLPDMHGCLLTRWMHDNLQLPVIILTAEDGIDQKVRGFECGADDYICKPFHPGEVLARIKAVLNRISGEPASDPTYILGDLRIDVAARLATFQSRFLPLTRREFDVLCELASRPGETISYEDLLRNVWHRSDNAMNVVRVQVHGIRAALARCGVWSIHIENLTGVGYKIEVGPTSGAIRLEESGADLSVDIPATTARAMAECR